MSQGLPTTDKVKVHDFAGGGIPSVNVTSGEDMTDKMGLVVATVGQGGWTEVIGDTDHGAVDTNNPIKIGGKASTSAPTAVDNGDRVNAWFDTSGRLQVGDGGGSLTVDGTVSVSGSVTTGGLTDAELRATPLNIDDGGGSVTVDGTISAVGNVAHSTTDSGNPVKIGGKASTSTPTAIAAGQRVDAWFDTNGRLQVGDGGGSLSVDDGGGTLTVDGVVSASQSGSWTINSITTAVTITDSGGSITVDDGASSITVDDGGGSITVDFAAGSTVDTELPAATTVYDGDTQQTTSRIGSYTLLWNDAEGNWDRANGNMQGTALASAARTATTTSGDIFNRNAKGVQIIWDMTVNGGNNVKLRIQGKDPTSGKYYYIHSDLGYYASTGTRVYELYPGATGTGGDLVQRTSGVLPRTWRIEIVHANSNSITYSVGYHLIV